MLNRILNLKIRGQAGLVLVLVAATLAGVSAQASGSTGTSKLKVEWMISNVGSFRNGIVPECDKAAHLESQRLSEWSRANGLSTDAITVTPSYHYTSACSRVYACEAVPLSCTLTYRTSRVTASAGLKMIPGHTAVTTGAGRHPQCEQDLAKLASNPRIFLARIQTVGWVFHPGCNVFYAELAAD